MKKLSVAYLVIAIVVLLVISIKAENILDTKKENAVKSLSLGLLSENSGLRASSALILGQLIDSKYINKDNTETAVIPLMKMLNKGNSDEERIAAALALYKIGDNRGIYKLKTSSKFDESKRVKDICYKLYYEFNRQNNTEYLITN
ncbi:MAG: HEAT repeat domain-containing protein [Ignavibacteriaceae bacterium]